MSNSQLKAELALDLYRIGAVKTGEFTYKSGNTGPMYLDLRLFISHPDVMKKVAKIYGEMLSNIKFDRLAGVAYAALPIAGAISLDINKPWIFLRKEGLKKGHGLKKSLEGQYEKDEVVVMVEDLVMKATSLLEATAAVRRHGLTVNDAVVLLDYQKGGQANLAKKNCKLHSFMSVTELLDILKNEQKISAEMHSKCIAFING